VREACPSCAYVSLDDGKPTRSVVRIEEVARLPIIWEIAGDTVVYGF
jgi:hypothetical protein